MKQTLLPALLVWLTIPLWGQQTRIFTEANQLFKEGKDQYDKGLFGPSRQTFEQSINRLDQVHEEEANLLRTQAELYRAQAAVRMDLPEGEKLMLEFIRKHQPDPVADQALYEIANYYFASKKFDKAHTYFGMLSDAALSGEQKSEVRFKQGYSLFLNKKFREAEAIFTSIKDQRNNYYYPANYYLGMCEYFLEKYDEAIASFEKVSKSTKYNKQIPYYISQISFAQGKYDEVITYGENALKQPRVAKAAEIHQLVGQSYFEQGNYEKALPHLEFYESKNRRLRKEEFYQLAYTQYLTANYTSAVKNFKQVSGDNSELGQNASFYLADCYLKSNDKKSARSAFKKASNYSFDPDIQEDALFNFALLSAELRYDADAISAYQRFGEDSKYYNEAQNGMTDLFLKTRDYESAIRIMERMPEMTPRVEEAYQAVTFYRGLQLVNDKRYDQALVSFNKSLEYVFDRGLEARSHFWKGEIAHRRRNYDLSLVEIGKFFNIIELTGYLPQNYEIELAHYIQGYNQLKNDDFKRALPHFENTIRGISRSSQALENPQIGQRVLSDAYMRSGDCYFKFNNYTSALDQYEQAIKRKHQGYQYAMFQRAMIEGLTGKVNRKIRTLNQIASAKPRSEYADDALLELGITYQEQGDNHQAKEPLLDLVQSFSKTSKLINQALLRLGLLYYNENNSNQALRYYKQVFDHNPTPKESQEALAAIEEIYVDDMGDPDAYIAFLEDMPGYEVSEFSRDSLNYRTAENYYEDGEYTKAIESYTNYLVKFPDGFYVLQAFYRRGECHSLLKNYRQALTDYEAVIKRGNSDYYEQSLYKAALIAYNDQFEFDKAFVYYQELVSVASSEDMRFEAQVGALQCAYRLDKPNEVLRFGEQVVSNPRVTTTQRTTAHFYIGKVAYDQREWSKSISSLTEVIKLSDNEQTAEARYLMASIYYEQNDIETAESLAGEAIQKNSNYHYWIAKCLILDSDIKVAKGDLLNAKAALEAVVENFSEDEELLAEANRKLEAIKKKEAQQNRIQPNKANSLLQLDNQGNQN